MSARDPFDLPPDKQRLRRRARILEWVTIAALLSIIVVLYFALGSSQAMKTAWFEDILSLIPPIAFLVASRVESRAPDRRFPYGYHRVVSIAFLVASVSLLAMGLFLLYDSLMKLVMQERPTIGTVVVLGEQVWLGWIMVGALVYSVIPPVILGHLKKPLATQLHDKVLLADADMNKADWLTGLAAIAGVLGIGIGWWWADAIAAMVISLDVAHDGFKNMKRVIRDLMDEQPTTVQKGREDPLPEQLREAVRALGWVDDASVRLREEGHVFTGEVFVVPRDETHLVSRLALLRRELLRNDWRLYDLSIVPVHSLREQGGRGGTPPATHRLALGERNPEEKERQSS